MWIRQLWRLFQNFAAASFHSNLSLSYHYAYYCISIINTLEGIFCGSFSPCYHAMNQNGNNAFSLICIFIVLALRLQIFLDLLEDLVRTQSSSTQITIQITWYMLFYLPVSIKLHIPILFQIFFQGVDSLIPYLDFLPSLNYLLRK